jgi:hypothetical protein
MSVIDTGTGIPAEKLKMIFDEYSQVDNPGRTRARGLGLGLSVVKHIARILGHRIEVTSELGHGSTFSVEICNDMAEVTRKQGLNDLSAAALDGEARGAVFDRGRNVRALLEMGSGGARMRAALKKLGPVSTS